MKVPAEFWKREDLTSFEKLVYLYLLENELVSAKSLAENLNVSEITIRRALATLRKLELVPKGNVSKMIQTPDVVSNLIQDVSKLIQGKSEKCIKTDTTCINPDTNCIKNDTNCIKTDTKSENLQNLREKKEAKKREIYEYRDKDLIDKNINLDPLIKNIDNINNINITKISKINDSDHKNNTSQKNSLVPIEKQDFQLTPLQESPEKPKRKVFVVPSVQEITVFMSEYVKKSREKYPDMERLDIERVAVEFFEFYETKGWIVGKEKMKNWNMAAQRWLRQNSDRVKYGQAPERKLTKEEMVEDYKRTFGLADKPDETITEVKETPEEYKERQRKEWEEYKKKYHLELPKI